MTLVLEAESEQLERDAPAASRPDERFPFPFVAASIVVSIALRLRFVTTPLSSDEGGYLAVARAWASGKSLYTDAWVDRPQGLLVLFRGWDSLTGGSPEAIRVMAIVFGCIAVLGVAYIAFRTRRRASSRHRFAADRRGFVERTHRGLHRERRTLGRHGRRSRSGSRMRLPVQGPQPVVAVRRRRARRLRHVVEAVGLRRVPCGDGLRGRGWMHGRTTVEAGAARGSDVPRRPRRRDDGAGTRRRPLGFQLVVVRDRWVSHQWAQCVRC